MLRSLFTVVGIVAVLGVFFFFIRPDWMKQMSSTPVSAAPTATTKINASLSAERLGRRDLPRDKDGYLQIEQSAGSPELLTKIVEEVGEDLPSRNMPFLLIVNKANDTMRYCRLGTGVRKISLRMAYTDVKFQEVVSTPGGPYQVVVWIPNAMDLQLEFEVAEKAPRP